MIRARFITITIAVVVAGLLLPPTAARAGYSDGGGFTAPGYGTRPWGMGGVVAIGGDESAIYWNPALLVELDRNRIGFSYVNIVPGAEAYQSQIAYAHILKRGPENEPGLAFNVHTVGALYENLRIELSDGQAYRENLLRLAYAYSPLYFVTVGASFNVMTSSSDVTGFGSDGTAIDIGGRVALFRGVMLGIVVRNALSEVKFDDSTTQSIGRSLTIGAAYRGIRNLAIEGNVESKFGSISRYVLGGEYRAYSDVLAVRAGLSSQSAGESRTVPHLGMGVQYERLRIDYNANFDSDDAFDTTHRFSLGLGF